MTTEQETTKRVAINLIIATERAPGDVHLSVLASLNDRWHVEHSSVHAFNVDDPGVPLVQLVIDPVGGLRAAYVDDLERAEATAKELGSVVIELAADADYRGEVNR